MSANDAVWERVQQMLPLHGCGQRLQPGGDPVIGHVLVCTNCSFFSAVDPEWVADLVDEARSAVEQEPPR